MTPRRWRLAYTLGRELSAGLTRLRRRPGSPLLVISAVAIGIGANVAIFSVANVALFAPLPFANPDRVVQLVGSGPSVPGDGDLALSLPGVLAYEGAAAFSSFAVLSRADLYETRGETIAPKTGAYASSSLLTIMGVNPALGRGFGPAEDRPGASPVVLLTWEYWQGEMGGDRNVVGRELDLSHFISGRGFVEAKWTVVGVLPSGFRLPALRIDGDYREMAEPEMIVPFGMLSAVRDQPGLRYVRALAELREGLTMSQAEEELGYIDDALVESDGYRVRLLPLAEVRRHAIGPPLFILWAASGLLLLVVCANVAGLLLAQGLSRSAEMGVRTAMGASWVNLFAQLFVEGLILGLSGALASIPFAVGASSALRRLLPTPLVAGIETPFRFETLLYTGGLCMAAVLLFALAPAAQGSRLGNPSGGLSRGAGISVGGAWRAMRGLVVAQASVALVLVVAAGLLIQSLRNLLNVDPGFRPEGVIRFSVSMPPPTLSKFEGSEALLLPLFREVRDRVEAIPGVIRVGGSGGRDGPLSGQPPETDVTIAGRAVPSAANRVMVGWHLVSSGYGEAVGLRLLNGRWFGDNEALAMTIANPGGGGFIPVPVVVNQRMADTFWAGEDPIGRQFYYGIQSPEALTFAGRPGPRAGEGADPRYPPPRPLEVVGVVSDAKVRGLAEQAPPAYYSPWPFTLSQLYVRVKDDPEQMVARIRAAIEATDPEIRITEASLMDQVVRHLTSPSRFRAAILGAFAATALLLTGVGLLGVVTYSVTQRQHEIAVRMSVGAARSQIFGLVVGGALRLSSIGLLLGIVLTLILARFITAFLFGVQPIDPWILASGVAFVSAVSLGAGVLPAISAANVDPMKVLRSR